MNPANGIDILLVLGAGKYESSRRARHALELARIGDFPIILSGYSSNGNKKSEAEYMHEILEAGGISSERLFLDSIARNTVQNIAYSRTLIEARNASRVGICTSLAHMSRAYRIARRFLPNHKIIRCPVPIKNILDFSIEMATFPLEILSSLKTINSLNQYQETHKNLDGYLGEIMFYNQGRA